MPRWLLAPAFVILGVGFLLIDAALHPASLLIGASGGVAAVIGACVVLQPRAQVAIKLWPLSFRLSMRGFFFAALALQALLGALHVAGVAWTAHLLGLAFGAAGAAVFRMRASARWTEGPR